MCVVLWRKGLGGMEAHAADIAMYRVERRDDGVLIVRVRSRDLGPATLPEAVFTFRVGDPQYEAWAQRLRDLEGQTES